MKDLLDKLLQTQSLSEDELQSVFTAMFAGELTPCQIASFLTAWRLAGESGKELAAGAKMMREAAISPPLPSSTRPLADNCGTGGDGSNSFNISTASAIVAAANGLKIAKHGNRSVSSKCGSADLLFAAGLPENLGPEKTAKLLEATGFTFFFAPHFHPVMKYVMPVRKELGVRTIFNFLGPLANPISPELQLIGVGDKRFLRPMAEAAQKLGIHKALVVHSEDGLDEISANDITLGFLVGNGEISEFKFDPNSELGIAKNKCDISGGDPSENLAILNRLFAGEKSGPFHAVCINAGALLWQSEKSSSIKEGYKLCQASIESGSVKTYFQNWIEKAKEMADK